MSHFLRPFLRLFRKSRLHCGEHRSGRAVEQRGGAMGVTGDESVTVLAIGGWGRCGGTLLDMLLGEIDGFVSAGEVREIWLRGCVENRPCGCGLPFAACPFWSQVGKEAFGGWGRLDLQALLTTRYGWDRAWRFPQLARNHS